jgi:hypothetical protein
MERRFFIFLTASIFLFNLLGCKSGTDSESDVINYKDFNLNENGKIISSFDTIGKGLPIFYNMYLSVEMATLFESIGAVFNSDLLNPTTKIPDYLTSSDKALNLGIYAVDLSYSRIFDQIEFTSKYFYAMQKLSEELGIPGDYFLTTAKRFDRNINNKDSLITIANEVYVATDNYLKENERYNASAQIILGGWTEAMYIAMDIARESREIDVFERVAEQKYSLENLIEMLNANADDEIIAGYLVRLDELRDPFEKLDAVVNKEIDMESEPDEEHIDNIIDVIAKLDEYISKLRDDIVG